MDSPSPRRDTPELRHTGSERSVVVETTVVFGPGPLGLGLQQLRRPSRRGGSPTSPTPATPASTPYFAAALEKFNALADGGVGPAQQCRTVEVNDVIAAVAGVSTQGMSYSKVLVALQGASRPMQVTFRGLRNPTDGESQRVKSPEKGRPELVLEPASPVPDDRYWLTMGNRWMATEAITAVPAAEQNLAGLYDAHQLLVPRLQAVSASLAAHPISQQQAQTEAAGGPEMFVASPEEAAAEAPANRKNLCRAQVHAMVPIQLAMMELSTDVSAEWIDSLYFKFDTDRNGFIDDEEWEGMSAALATWKIPSEPAPVDPETEVSSPMGMYSVMETINGTRHEADVEAKTMALHLEQELVQHEMQVAAERAHERERAEQQERLAFATLEDEAATEAAAQLAAALERERMERVREREQARLVEKLVVDLAAEEVREREVELQAVGTVQRYWRGYLGRSEYRWMALNEHRKESAQKEELAHEIEQLEEQLKHRQLQELQQLEEQLAELQRQKDTERTRLNLPLSPVGPIHISPVGGAPSADEERDDGRASASWLQGFAAGLAETGLDDEGRSGSISPVANRSLVLVGRESSDYSSDSPELGPAASSPLEQTVASAIASSSSDDDDDEADVMPARLTSTRSTTTWTPSVGASPTARPFEDDGDVRMPWEKGGARNAKLASRTGKQLSCPMSGKDRKRGLSHLGAEKASGTGKQLGKSQVRLMVRIQLQIEEVDVSKVTDSWIDSLFDRFDSDNSGTMDDEEWEKLSEILKVEAGKIGTPDAADAPAEPAARRGGTSGVAALLGTGKALSRAQVHAMVPIQLEMDGLPPDVSAKWIDSLYYQFDQDRNGFIDDEEWERMTAALSAWKIPRQIPRTPSKARRVS